MRFSRACMGSVATARVSLDVGAESCTIRGPRFFPTYEMAESMSEPESHYAFVDDLLRKLGPMGAVTTDDMFGGTALYYHGYLFGITYKGRVYFRTNSGSRDAYLAAGMQAFAPSERVTLKDYYEVPEPIQADLAQLCAWARRAASTQNG